MRSGRRPLLAVLVLGAAAVSACATPPTRVAAARPGSPDAASDRLALVRGGVAFPLLVGERVEIARELTATIGVSPVAGTRYARVLRLGLAGSAGPVSDASVKVNGHMRYMDHGSFATAATNDGDGAYVAELPFAMAGEWQIDVAIAATSATGVLSLELDSFK